MSDYNGVKCPVCEVPFRENDDVVVCPQCGAPYHRHCYSEKGRCIYENEHAEGRVWEFPKPPEAPDLSSEIKDNECPACGTLNAHSALFCNHCGASLAGEPELHSNMPPPFMPASRPASFGGPVSPFFYDPMGGVSPTEMLDDSVTFGDASKLVKQNTNYYMPVFRRIKSTKRNKFNFCAFLFSGPWMLYRKQYKKGALVTILMFGLYIASILTNIFISSPVLRNLMERVGMDPNGAFTPSSTELTSITAILTNDPVLYFQFALPVICMACMLVVMIICGIRGNKMYMKHCIQTIQGIKAKEETSEVAVAIEAKSGVNVAIAICLFVCYTLLSYLPGFIF